MAEQFEEKKDNISEEEIKDTASTNEDNNGTVNQDEHTEEAVETVENKDTAEASDTASDSSSSTLRKYTLPSAWRTGEIYIILPSYAYSAHASSFLRASTT